MQVAHRPVIAACDHAHHTALSLHHQQGPRCYYAVREEERVSGAETWEGRQRRTREEKKGKKCEISRRFSLCLSVELAATAPRLLAPLPLLL